MDNHNRNIEDSGTEGDLTVGAWFKGIKASMWPRDQSCDSSVRNVTAFCPCPNVLPEAKLMNFGLIMLTEKIFKQLTLSCDYYVHSYEHNLSL